jgi:hypothetical protein
MKLENMYATMTANRLVAIRRFTITLLILSILTAIVLSVSIWLTWRMLSMGNGVLIDHSIKLPQQICLPSDAQARLRLITEHPKDYLECLDRAMKT